MRRANEARAVIVIIFSPYVLVFIISALNNTTPATGSDGGRARFRAE